MENQKQRKSAGTVVLVVLLLIVTIAALILATYAWARYTTVETGRSTAQVAKWDVEFTENQNEFVKTFTYVTPGKVAPGTNGRIDMTISSSETEVAYDYSILLKNIQNKPTNLHFYTDDTHQHEITLNAANTATADNNTLLSGEVLIDGTSKVAATTLTPKIYWNWEYQTNTAADWSKVTTYKVEKTQRAIHDLYVYAVTNGVALSGVETSVNATTGVAEPTTSDSDATNITTINSIVTQLTTAGKSAADVNKVVNDAIDTVDGIHADTMTVDVVFTATQKEPVEE